MNRLLPYSRLPLSTPIVVLALFILMMVVWMQSGSASVIHLLFLFSSYFSWAFLLPFVQGIVASSSSELKGIAAVVAKAIVLIFLHFLLSNIIYYLLQYLLVRPFVAPTLSLLGQIAGPSLLARTVDFILFFGLLSWVQRSRELNEKKMLLVATEANLQTMRLRALQSQLNPHFLFNTLHTVSSLIGRNDDKAREMTIKISRLLRKVLESNEQDSYPLHDELELVRDYLSIEQERFRDRLTVELQLDDAAAEVVVPTLILQPLVENAFKHGVAQVEGKTHLSVAISCDDKEGTLTIEVVNDIPAAPAAGSPSTGIGLANLKARLDTFYKRDIAFSAGKIGASGYRVAYTIPIEP